MIPLHSEFSHTLGRKLPHYGSTAPPEDRSAMPPEADFVRSRALPLHGAKCGDASKKSADLSRWRDAKSSISVHDGEPRQAADFHGGDITTPPWARTRSCTNDHAELSSSVRLGRISITTGSSMQAMILPWPPQGLQVSLTLFRATPKLRCLRVRSLCGSATRIEYARSRSLLLVRADRPVVIETLC